MLAEYQQMQEPIKYLIRDVTTNSSVSTWCMSRWFGLGRWAPWTGVAPSTQNTFGSISFKIILIEWYERPRLFGAADDQSSIDQRSFICSVAIPVHQTWYYTKNNFLDFMANVVGHFLKVQKRRTVRNIHFTLEKKWRPLLSSYQSSCYMCARSWWFFYIDE